MRFMAAPDLLESGHQTEARERPFAAACHGHELTIAACVRLANMGPKILSWHAMKLKTGIGITTYQDISSPDFAAIVYDAYLATSPRIVPTRVDVWSKKHAVIDRDAFSAHWMTETDYKVMENRSKSSAVLEKGQFRVGAKWRTTGRLSGQGEVRFRPKLDSSRTNEIVIKHKFDKAIDWAGLFERLVEATQPAYAMLHVFDEEETYQGETDRIEAFNRPFAGEAYFTQWKTPLGTWRKPDSWQLEERRRYRFLPNLSWSNFLGPEFDGQYNHAELLSRAESVRPKGKGILLEVTGALSDVVDRREWFQEKQDLVKGAFAPGFFRTE